MRRREAGKCGRRVLWAARYDARRRSSSRLRAQLTLVLPFATDADHSGRHPEGDGRGNHRRGLEQRREQDQKGGRTRKHETRVADGK